MSNQEEVCKKAGTCRYGYTTKGGPSFCIYMVVHCRPRSADPKGEIVNGQCGFYEDWSDERSKRRAQDRKRDKK